MKLKSCFLIFFPFCWLLIINYLFFILLNSVDSDYARQKFGNQKAISSDQYFGRNDYDPETLSTASDRLKQFEGANSISSNQYFGREDDDIHQRESLDLTGIEINAKDFARKFIGQATSDYEIIKNVVERGGEKLKDYLADMQVSNFMIDLLFAYIKGSNI